MQKNYSMNKGIIFIGCSFTYGYGLPYYYQKETNQQFNGEYRYWYEDILSPKEQFRLSKRFAGLVSSNLQTWSVTREGVSGNDLENIEFLKQAFNMKPQDAPNFCRWKLKPNEISDIIIQTSYPIRSNAIYDSSITHQMLNEDKDLEERIMYQITSRINKEYQEICEWAESNGINTHFIHITPDYLDSIYIKDRTIKIDGWYSIDAYMNNTNGRIIDDLDIEDYHPNLTTHKVIAKEILNKIS